MTIIAKIIFLFIYTDKKTWFKYCSEKKPMVDPFCIIYHESSATLYSEFWTAHNYIKIQLGGKEHLSVCN